jgi:hypothetical protein
VDLVHQVGAPGPIRKAGAAFAALCTDDVVMELPFASLRFAVRADVCDRATLA